MAAFLAAVMAGAASGPAAAAELVGIRFGVTSPSATRVVIDSNGALDYALDADESGSGRLFINMTDARYGTGFAVSGRGTGHVAGYTVSGPAGVAAALRIDLGKSSKIKQILALEPSKDSRLHRLVIDLADAPPGSLVASLPPRKFGTITDVIASVAPPQAVMSEPSPQAAVIAPPTPKPIEPTEALPPAALPVVVIDAGHGGSDPGAAGPSGAEESKVTLAAALVLAEALRQTGRYEVVLTRSTDIRLAHEERSRIARDARAALFISLHADAIADSKVRGGSVYTLSDEGTERSAREAREKGDYLVFDLNIGEADPQVGGILYNLAQRRTSNESDAFAELLIDRLSGVTPLLNNTHRRGNFKVLLAPDVPAVLLELAFISNARDEANLSSHAWRKRTMAAAAGAIDAYFQQKGATRHASNAIGGAPR